MITGMAVVPVEVSNELRAPRLSLPPGFEQQAQEFLSVPNGAKEKELKLGGFGAEDMPDFIDLWRVDGAELVMPRGFALLLRRGLEASGHQVDWIDRTVAPQIPLNTSAAMLPINLRDDQERAADEMLAHRQGVLESPTASGKTVTTLEVFRRTGCRGIVFVDKTGLAEQWRRRAREHLGIEAGLIGDGVWDERELTIAMIQTVYRRRPDLSHYGFAVFDECHHAVAETWQEVILMLVARYVFGLTATPLDNDWRRRILEAVLGPVFHVVPRDQLRQRGVITQPVVQVVRTPFVWRPNAQQRRLRDSRAIYRHITAALISDEERNRKIASTLAANMSAANLVFSERLNHLRVIKRMALEMGWPAERVWTVIGDVDRDARQEIADAADEGGCVIFSTVAKEGTDIPRLDRLYMTWPLRRDLPVSQLCGRVERTHPAKEGAVIYDFADLQVPVLRSQFYSRLKLVYRPRGYVVRGLGDS